VGLFPQQSAHHPFAPVRALWSPATDGWGPYVRLIFFPNLRATESTVLAGLLHAGCRDPLVAGNKTQIRRPAIHLSTSHLLLHGSPSTHLLPATPMVLPSLHGRLLHLVPQLGLHGARRLKRGLSLQHSSAPGSLHLPLLHTVSMAAGRRDPWRALPDAAPKHALPRTRLPGSGLPRSIRQDAEVAVSPSLHREPPPIVRRRERVRAWSELSPRAIRRGVTSTSARRWTTSVRCDPK
jgi:hypothetical protein